MKGITWEIVAQIDGASYAQKAKPKALSYNTKDLPSGKELVTLAFGHDLDDIRGIIHETTSYWSIDESGSVGRTAQSLGKAITYSAVTQLSTVDYKKLFEGIPKSKDKDGNEEIHYRDLRRENPEKLKELVYRIADEPFLILTLPVMKDKEDMRTKWKTPKNATYVLRAINKLIEAIEKVDSSDLIIVSFDKTDEVNDIFLNVLISDRVIVQMQESHWSELFQVCDVSTSVIGNAINYPGEYDNDLFWKLYDLSTNLSSNRANADEKRQSSKNIRLKDRILRRQGSSK